MTPLKQIADTLTKAQPMTDWQPIETAPREGTVLGYAPAEREPRRIATMQMKAGKPFIVNGCFAFDMSPVTHWAPLPAPPQDQDNAHT